MAVVVVMDVGLLIMVWKSSQVWFIWDINYQERVSLTK